MFDRLGELASEHAELERALADPGVHADAEKARNLGRRYAELTPIVHAYTEWRQLEGDEATARELAAGQFFRKARENPGYAFCGFFELTKHVYHAGFKRLFERCERS